jgi:hypothetical protein
MLSIVATVTPSAHATLFIGLQQDVGPIITVASNSSGSSVFRGSFGQFEAVMVSGTGKPTGADPFLLQSGSFLTNSAGAGNAGTLTVYVTSTGNAIPPGLLSFESRFATSGATAGWLLTVETYLDPGNGVYALTIPLGAASFSSVGSEADVSSATLISPYSVTGVYRMRAPSFGGANALISVAAAPVETRTFSASHLSALAAPIPEPETAVLFSVGLIVIALARSRRALLLPSR